MTDYTELNRSLRNCSNNRCAPFDCGWFDKYQVDESCKEIIMWKAAAAIEELQAEAKRLQGKLCDWCAVCPKERRNPDDCELLGENPVMYGPSGAKMEVQDG